MRREVFIVTSRYPLVYEQLLPLRSASSERSERFQFGEFWLEGKLIKSLLWLQAATSIGRQLDKSGNHFLYNWVRCNLQFLVQVQNWRLNHPSCPYVPLCYIFTNPRMQTLLLTPISHIGNCRLKKMQRRKTWWGQTTRCETDWLRSHLCGLEIVFIFVSPAFPKA